MCIKEKGNYDIKMLALKRWDLDQTNKLFGLDVHRGDYISFQGYHFIDIISPPNNQELRDIYQNFRQKTVKICRNPLDGSEMPKAEDGTDRQTFDTHMVQSMTILSNDRHKEFWEAEAPLLGITFLQLTDSTQWHFENIQKELETIIGGKMQWALYYSLDFCDLVLFTKNFEIEKLHDALWEVALVRERNCKVVCDTFTVLCFAASYLKGKFERIDALNKTKKVSGDLPAERMWQERLSLSINLSIKNTTSLSKLIKNIDAENINFTQYRQYGRYDVNIQIPDITGEQAIKVLYLIDQQASFKKRKGKKQTQQDWQNEDGIYQPIGNYEVIFMTGAWKSKHNKELFPESRQEFETRVLFGLNTMLELLEDSQGGQSEYIHETIRALRELANNGFSEEFILSVYPSFVAYIKLLEQIKHIARSGNNTSVEKSWNNITKSYFTALNTLSLCTMHSERQFIHAPAFNASYFEIPPKLLAFYNAVVDRFAKAMSGKSEIPYSYMITPDYRADINVHPLYVEYKQDTSVHLAIIHLPEKYFYDPESAIMLLSHEVGHYEGERNRELRAKSIFTMVGIVLLMETTYFPEYDESLDEIPKTSLIATLARSFGEYLYDTFVDEIEPHRGISGLLSDVAKFLESNVYGLKFFDIEESRQVIIQRWEQCLRTEYTEADFPKNDVIRILNEYGQKINVSYYELLQDGKPQSAIEPVCRILADRCAKNIQVGRLRGSRKNIEDQCQTIIQSFGEAFSDMQMVRVCGGHFNLGKFVELILQNTPNNLGEDVANKITLEHIIRYNTICKVFGFSPEDSNLQMEDAVASTIVECISDYIQTCKKLSSFADEDVAFVRAFLSEDPFGQCKWISRVLSEYKAELTADLENVSGSGL